MGLLWEQFIITERIKRNSSNAYYPQYYFWRTYDGQEIDLLEINSHQEIQAFECKWSEKKAKIPVAFEKAYPNAKWQEINKTNYLEWIE